MSARPKLPKMAQNGLKLYNLVKTGSNHSCPTSSSAFDTIDHAVLNIA